jgi:PAS domain S-box-containing protein
VRLPGLRGRLLAAVLGGILLVGGTVTLFVENSLYRILTGELEERGVLNAHHVAQMSVDGILTEDVIGLHLLSKNYLEDDPEARYVFLKIEEEKILAHSFSGGFPSGLLKVNPLASGMKYSKEFLRLGEEEVLDVAVPVLGGEAGELHIGMSMERIQERVQDTRNTLAGIILVVLLMGGGAASLYALRVTRPLADLTETAKRIGAGDLERRVSVDLKDEIGELASTINAMADNLSRTMISRSLYHTQSEFLSSVLNAIPHPFYVIDAYTYEIVAANAATGKEWEGKTCHQLTHRREVPCDEEHDLCPLEMVREKREPVVVEHIHYDAEGRERTHEVHGYPIFDGSGEVMQMIEYLMDITPRKEAEKEREELVKVLQEALAEVKRLSGLLPICASCKKVRDDKGYWEQVEIYVEKHTEAEFSHSICPECEKKLYPDL